MNDLKISQTKIGKGFVDVSRFWPSQRSSGNFSVRLLKKLGQFAYAAQNYRV